MAKRKIKACISEEVKIAIDLKIKSFLSHESQREYEFPSSLSNEERKYIHQQCLSLGLKTKSRGKGFNRYLTVYKKEGSSIISKDADISLGPVSQRHTITLLQRYPVSEKEHKELQPLTEKEKPNNSNSHGTFRADNKELNCTTGRLSIVIPQIPPPLQNNSTTNDMIKFRQSLPIWKMRSNIMRVIAENPIVLICGDTGCGKTTQVPQFILEYSTFVNKPCRIITTEPRRLAALSVAERVAYERGENIGQTVGYQIRLESKVSPITLLTFCTNGVLLRTLMGGDNGLATVTHIIIDEIHERDRLSDLLILVFKELMPKFPNLKLILMSATLNTEKFSTYFNNCPVIHIPGMRFEVSTFFLEDILKITGYMTPGMREYKKSLKQKDKKQQVLLQWCRDANSCNLDLTQAKNEASSSNSDNYFETAINEKFDLDLDPKLEKTVDDAIKSALLHGTNEAFEELLSLIMNENVSVDYQHSETGVTALIAAVCRGKVIYIETLLALGANITLCTPNNWDALKWAKNTKQDEICKLLEAYWKCCDERSRDAIELNDNVDKLDLCEDDKELLEIYHHSFNDEEVDINLIFSLLYKICTETDCYLPDQTKGAILVFLPGYDEIVRLRELILTNLDLNKYILYTLHSQMQSSDQKRVFRRAPPDVRKIILSTNLAETSITIDDVVYVIDSGKVKEISYDALLGVSMLKSTWVSQANAIQRRGRAGRCRNGICYHLFSKYRFNNMIKYQVPEMLRTPIHELCLQTKLLSPINSPVADFLSKALDPPSISSVKSSVNLLKTIDALDPFEQLTELGLHLLDLPVEPNLGKMILYSVVLKCLDPVLTIVCSLAYRDPFLIPAQPGLKRALATARKQLAAGTFSDHMTLLRAFQAWQKARNEGYERTFLEQNFICAATMEMIVGMRAQLLGQLRASGFVRARGAGDIRDLNTYSENWAIVKAAICAGCYPNVIRIDRERHQLVTKKENRVRFHSSSVFNDNPVNPKANIYMIRAHHLELMPSEWIVYEEMTRVSYISYARCCTLVTPITVALFAGPARLSSDAFSSYGSYVETDSDSESEEKGEREKAHFKIDDWISFKVNPDIARLVFQLRQKWHSLFLRRMSVPSKPLSQSDETVIKAIVEVLTAEEASLGLQQPVGIGQRPRPMSTDFCPPISNIDLRSPVQNSKMMKKNSGRPLYK
ncbi:putative ATP-dependent RNA helicase YTHDC2-like protein [Dinothrombium tinctorium]|uniref:Putative ATP-dependent RNA helicase YTHDC2-like protein n=1 Tax=Dinothrombium tinctorium TaxID=1965070 RepID=A0A3S3P5C8_9ACAR|nr:putative ATP-dependent RNA helicase YTHDC2-like protein [Dinothrombium tinctorium]RWS15279.1 putative ATP-dependent RNA helicase YTHDC2-like protein [Dinothrombium tinctorium]